MDKLTHYGYWLRLLLICLLAPFLCAAEPLVYYWPFSTPHDTRGDYPLALLRLAIDKSGAQYQLIPSGELMTQHRTLRQLGAENGVDLVWTMTSAEREKNYRAIRIPIDRGLLGWRLLIIRREQMESFSAFSEKTLKTTPSVQGSEWPDYQIFKANHFKVLPGDDFDAMFKMVQAKRVDYFARSVTEIWPELQQKADMSLTVAPKWAFYYPTALYFFVHKDNVKLAEAIETGLQSAIEDDSMKQLFLQHFSKAIQQADLQSRTILLLHNPILPAETPLQNKELWFDPQRGY